MARPATLDHLRSRKKPTTRTVELVLDPELADEYNKVKDEVELCEMRLRINADDPDVEVQVAEARESLRAIRERIDEEEAIVTFKFKSLPPHVYDELVNYHEATPEQRKKAKADGDRLQFNPDTFPQALVAECSMDPVLSLDEVESLWKDPNWNAAECQLLFGAALEANQSRRVIDLGKDSGRTPSTD